MRTLLASLLALAVTSAGAQWNTSPAFWTSSGPPALHPVLLMHLDGANLGTTFTDSSLSAHSFSVNSGTPTTSTIAPKFGTADGLFPTDPDNIQTAGSNDFIFGTNVDFAIGCFVKPTLVNASIHWILGSYRGGTTSGWTIGFDNANLQFRIGNPGNPDTVISFAATIPAAPTWTWIEVDRASGTLYLSAGGTIVGSASLTQSFGDPTKALQIGGGQYPFTDGFRGDIDECVIYNGNALNTTNFTPPTGPFSP